LEVIKEEGRKEEGNGGYDENMPDAMKALL
jgi:hypothetical protein